MKRFIRKLTFVGSFMAVSVVLLRAYMASAGL